MYEKKFIFCNLFEKRGKFEFNFCWELRLARLANLHRQQLNFSVRKIRNCCSVNRANRKVFVRKLIIDDRSFRPFIFQNLENNLECLERFGLETFSGLLHAIEFRPGKPRILSRNVISVLECFWKWSEFWTDNWNWFSLIVYLLWNFIASKSFLNCFFDSWSFKDLQLLKNNVVRRISLKSNAACNFLFEFICA